MPDPNDQPESWLQRAFEEHRRELHVHCYRLCGNVADAEDLVQETYLRAWRAREGFEGRSSARTWLYRIATNLFLDSRKAAARRTVPSGDPFEWSTELGPYPDALPAEDPQSRLDGRETVELAMIAALMHLPARQRAAFVLRDVCGWSTAEISSLLDAAPAAVNSLLQRARSTLRRAAPTDPGEWRRPVLTAEDEEILRRYAAARDAQAFRDLLSEDVRITMPPEAPVVGIDAAAEFLGRPFDWRSIPTTANGRPALLNYLRHPGEPHHRALVVDVLRIEGGRIAEINAFVGARHVAGFGVPLELPPEDRSGDHPEDRPEGRPARSTP